MMVYMCWTLFYCQDFGYVQTTSTEMLKSYVFNEPIVVDAARLQSLGHAAHSSLFMQGSKRMPGTAVTKSVVATDPGGRRREEIFVDLIEKISITFSSSGYILTSEIDGTIQMKSYLTGNPEIRLALNDDLSIGRGGRSVYDYRSSSGSGAVILDDCNFHESVRLDSFEMDKTLSLVPPDGEFTVMNYRLTQEFKPPFRVNTLIEEVGALKIVGGSEHTLRAKLIFSQGSHGNITKESGPVSMTFTIPMYNASRLQIRLLDLSAVMPNVTWVKYLQIAKKSGTYNPFSGNEVLASRFLADATLPVVPELPKPELPPLPTLPNLPKPELPLPKVELPPIPHIPTLPKPELPSLPKPELPTVPQVAKPELPPLPKLPELPPLPHLPDLPKPTLPTIPSLPSIPVSSLPTPHSTSRP
uniref:MHD domain-containing protein n=1 Tax=Fagus sylvatica TaxID=28930 RepID=A0A2N9FLL4_FAGSY